MLARSPVRFIYFEIVALLHVENSVFRSALGTQKLSTHTCAHCTLSYAVYVRVISINIFACLNRSYRAPLPNNAWWWWSLHQITTGTHTHTPNQTNKKFSVKKKYGMKIYGKIGMHNCTLRIHTHKHTSSDIKHTVQSVSISKHIWCVKFIHSLTSIKTIWRYRVHTTAHSLA